MPRKKFGPKKGEVTGAWRRLPSEKLHGFCFSPNIIRIIKSRRMRWAWYVARMEERRGAYRVLVGRPEGKRRVRRPRVRCEDNIKVYLQEIGWGSRLD